MKRPFSIRSIALTGSVLLQLNTLCFRAHAAAGDVDLSFDPGSGVNGTVNAVGVQPDGKVIIAGEFTMVKGLARSGIARLNADGSGDISFDAGAHNYNASGHTLHVVALQPDGKVLVGHDNGFIRLLPDGSVDTNFNQGITTIEDVFAGWFDYVPVLAAAVQSDGKVLVGGRFNTINWTNESVGIVRLHADGSLDTNFNAWPGLGGASVYAVVVQPDGKLLVGGQWSTGGGTNNSLVRLNADGSLDSSFNTGQNLSGYIYSVALQSDGKVFIGGDIWFSGPSRMPIVRLNANGSLDGSFDPGPVVGNLPYGFGVRSVVVQSDGKVLIGGSFTNVDGASRNRIARLNTNGTLDTAFNPGTGADGMVSSVALQSDGKVFLGGTFSTVNGTNRNRLARLEADGSLDVSFDPGRTLERWISGVAAQPDGKILFWGGNYSGNGAPIVGIGRLNANGSRDSSFDPGSGVNYGVVAAALQTDGKVVIGGSFTVFNGTNRLALARLSPDGGLESNFIPDLVSLVQFDEIPPFFGGYYRIAATTVIVQPDGKILVAGYTMTNFIWDDGYATTLRSFLVRFNADGNPDAGFTPAIGNQMDGNDHWWPGGVAYYPGSAIALQPDGKIILGGYFSSINGSNRPGIARVNANGSLDNAFNPAIGAYDVGSIALQPDGKLVFGGRFHSVSGPFQSFGIARLNASGSVDVTFDAGEIANGGYSVVLQPDGKIILGGFFASLNGTNGYGVARLNANGSLDSTFTPATGSNPGIASIALQPDGKVLLAGGFLTVNGVLRPYIARLNGDSVALRIVRSNSSVIVSWPTGALSFQLQESTNLTLPNAWSPVTDSAVTNGAQISVTVPTSAERKFFRLKSQ